MQYVPWLIYLQTAVFAIATMLNVLARHHRERGNKRLT